MKNQWLGVVVGLVSIAAVMQLAAAEKRTAKEGLQPLQGLIGAWRGTGEPKGTREEKQKGFWSETITWEWQFKGTDAWLKAVVEKGKHTRGAELRYLSDDDSYQLTLKPADGKNRIYKGKLKDRRLTLDEASGPSETGRRIVLSLLHANRYLFRYEEKPVGRTTFVPEYQVGATKEGVPFAGKGNEKECVVTGGVGTMPVTFKGKTYYVCCSGCRDAFNEEPEKFVKEFEARQANEK